MGIGGLACAASRFQSAHALFGLRKVSDLTRLEDYFRLSFFPHDRVGLAFPYNDARVPISKIFSLPDGGVLGRGRTRIECWHWLASVVEIEGKNVD
ncbi:hypothetical protein [Rhizobium sp. RM]|uniref:hypothetical protein n=1 Tax=Rhizobium sp. RM TaxID=2748079 RepID=UPI0017BB32E4|nr:hypothetical protein [Rhizobium sp. RM]NWJ27636.1 hypothetical protein [Rhizobium sp. RM]